MSKNEGGEITVSACEYQSLSEEAKQKQEYFNKLLRLQAEFENFKKRSDKNKQQFKICQ